MNLSYFIRLRVHLASVVFTAFAALILIVHTGFYVFASTRNFYEYSPLVLVTAGVLAVIAASRFGGPNDETLIEEGRLLHTNHWVITTSTGAKAFVKTGDGASIVTIVMPVILFVMLAIGSFIFAAIVAAFMLLCMWVGAMLEMDSIANVEKNLNEGTVILSGNKRRLLEGGIPVIEMDFTDRSKPIWLADTPDRRAALYAYRLDCIGKQAKDAPAPYTDLAPAT